MNAEKMIINRPPSITWYSLGINGKSVSPFSDTAGAIIGIDCPKAVSVMPVNPDRWKGDPTGAGESFASSISNGIELSFSGTIEEPIKVSIRLSGLEEKTGALYIRALEGAKAEIVINISREDDTRAGIRTVLYARENSDIKLTQVYDCPFDSEVISDTGITLMDSASVMLNGIFMKARNVFAGTKAVLEGARSVFDYGLGYLLTENDMLDLNSVVLHKGKKTLSHTAVRGAMSGESQKVFRGTIDFRAGSSGSEGGETEDVLLLSDSVINKTMPVILCDEEDVSGSHGASIGRVPEEQVYYMMSRGIPYEQVYSMLASSKIEGIINRIGDEKTREDLSGRLSRRFSDVIDR